MQSIMEPSLLVTTHQFPVSGNKDSDSKSILNSLKGVPSLKQVRIVSTKRNIISELSRSHILQIFMKEYMSTDTDVQVANLRKLTNSHSFLVILQSESESFELEKTSPVITLLSDQIECSFWNFVVSALALGVTLVFYDGEHRKSGGCTTWHLIDRYKVRHALIMESHIDFLKKTKIQPNPKSSFQFLRRIILTRNSLSELQKEYLCKYLKNGVFIENSYESLAFNGASSSQSLVNDIKCSKPESRNEVPYLNSKDSKFCNIKCSCPPGTNPHSGRSIDRIVQDGYHLLSEADTARRLRKSPRKSPTYEPPCFCVMFIYVFLAWMFGMFSE